MAQAVLEAEVGELDADIIQYLLSMLLDDPAGSAEGVHEQIGELLIGYQVGRRNKIK